MPGIVGGFTDPQGSRVGLGALLVGHLENEEFVFAGKIGTGFDTKLLLQLRARLDAASAPAATFPYIFFGSEVQGSLHAGAVVGTKPPGYFPSVRIAGRGASG